MLLVTGITGHTGSHFLNTLIKNQYKGNIRCIVRVSSDTSLIDNSGLKIEKFIGTLDDREFLKMASTGVETIVHIYNIHHSVEILKAAIQNNVNRVILVHTTGIYSKFKSASENYKNIEKELSEILKENKTNISLTILRPTMIYGELRDRNVSTFIKIVDSFRIIPIINDGRNFIQPVYAGDLGMAYYKVLINPNKVADKSYNLSGEKPIRMKEFLELVSKELNKKTIFISIPLKLGVLIATLVKIFTLKRFDYVEKVQRMAEDRCYPHEEAITDFGYNPILFEKGIKNEVKQYLEEKNK